METIKLSDNKEFKKVKDYMSDYFQNSNHYLFSDSVDVLTKSNGEKYSFMYCFHCEENEDIPILGVALLWHESKTTNLIMFFMGGILKMLLMRYRTRLLMNVLRICSI